MAKLGDQAVGSIVKLNVNGTATNFIVVHQGLPSSLYDSSCDGTWLLMEDIYTNSDWGNRRNVYASSGIHIYLNNTFTNLFDSDLNNVIKQVKIPYINGIGNSDSLEVNQSGLSTQIFLLSHAEVGFSGSYTNAEGYTEGSVLSYFNGAADSKRVAKFNGTESYWWLRSPRENGSMEFYCVGISGNAAQDATLASYGVRPVLILPYDLKVAGDGFVDGSVSKPSIGQVTIGGTQKELTGLGYANIGGIWKELVKSYVNVGGVWKEAFEAAKNITVTLTHLWYTYMHSTDILEINGVQYTNGTEPVIITVPSGSILKIYSESLGSYGSEVVNNINGDYISKPINTPLTYETTLTCNTLIKAGFEVGGASTFHISEA